MIRKDKIRNEHIRETTREAQDSKKDHREKIELVRACEEEIWRTPTEESVEGGYTREKEQRDLKSTGLRAGEQTDRATWRRNIISYTGDPT